MSGPDVDVVTFGETMVSLRGAGPCRFPSAFQAAPAGAESNVAIGLRRLGHSVRWISRLGTDVWGDGILSTLRSERVDVDGVVRDARRPTGLMALLRRPGGNAEVDYRRAGSAASALTSADVVDAMGQPRYLHLTGITPALSSSARDACFAAIEAARTSGATVSFDVNFRSRLWRREDAAPVLRYLARSCDIVIGGGDELHMLAEAPEHLLDLGVAMVVRKLGERGAEAWDGNGRVEHGGFPAAVVDTVGAGDGFCAGLLSGLLDGLELVNALERGNIVGACAVESLGDWTGYPERLDLARFAGSEDTLR